MKKILYGMLLLTGMSGAAVQRSQNGQGDAMIIPFYTVQQGHDSVFVVQNNSAESKAMIVNLREKVIGAVVMSVNVYLAPGDEWRAQLSQLSNGTHGVDTTQYRKIDSSCTPYMSDGWELVPYSMWNYPDAGGIDMTRSQIGYIEVIEMGTVLPPASDHLILVNDVPSDCDAIEVMWGFGGDWNDDPVDYMAGATGGVAAHLELTAQPGTMVGGSALTGFLDAGAVAHFEPGGTYPDLTASQYLAEGSGFETSWLGGSFHVSAAVTRYLVDAIEGTFDLSNGQSEEWLVTLLNRNNYAYVGGGNGGGLDKPYLHSVQDNGGCEFLDVLVYDLQGQLQSGLNNAGFDLCQSVNVIGIEGVDSAASKLVSQLDRIIDVGSLTEGRVVIKTRSHWTMAGVNVVNPSQEIIHYGLPLEAVAYQESGGVGAFKPLTLHRRTVLDVIFANGVD